MTRKVPRFTVVRKLLALSGNVCGFKGCENQLIYNGVFVGELAHITAAEPNGPRYDVTKDDEYRRSFDNLLFMCANHHTIIDKSELVKDYPAELLYGMKAEHEKKYSERKLEVTDSIIEEVIEQVEITQGNVLYNGTQNNIQQNFIQSTYDASVAMSKAADITESQGIDAQEPVGESEQEIEEAGYLDRIADAEIELPLWTKTIEDLAVEVGMIGPVFQAGIDAVEKSDRLNKGISGRVAVFKGVANNLSDTADNIHSLGITYLEQFNRIDSGILAAVEIMELSPEKKAEFKPLVDGVIELADSANQGFEPVMSMIESMQPLSAMSRDMKKTLSKIKGGFEPLLESVPRIKLWREKLAPLMTEDQGV